MSITNLQKLNLPKDKSLFAHQVRFIEKNPDKAMLVHETGTGKSITAICWMKLRPETKFLVTCPKGIIEKWKRDIKEWGDHLMVDVFSRDDIKKIDLKNYGGIVLDEAQDYSSPLFDKSRSKRAEVVYKYVREHPQSYILLLTATPVRSTPWNIHTLACYLKIFWDIRDFRNKFFFMTDKFGIYHYEKRYGWQKMIRPNIEGISDIVLMSDCVDVPTQHHRTIQIPWTKKQEEEVASQDYDSPIAEWHNRHRIEQGEPKWKKLEELLDGYRKVIIVCHYRSQIDDYVKRIGDQRLVFVLNGSVKDQDKVIEEAKSADDCIFIIQAQMGAGFDAGEFSVVIFASMSFRYVDYVQMKGRVKRINNLHENTFIHLIGGENDQAVYDTIQTNKDFDVHDYLARTSSQVKQARGTHNPDRTKMVPEELPF
jgi:superfamily II DNA or RNA helicase